MALFWGGFPISAAKGRNAQRSLNCILILVEVKQWNFGAFVVLMLELLLFIIGWWWWFCHWWPWWVARWQCQRDSSSCGVETKPPPEMAISHRLLRAAQTIIHWLYYSTIKYHTILNHAPIIPSKKAQALSLLPGHNLAAEKKCDAICHFIQCHHMPSHPMSSPS